MKHSPLYIPTDGVAWSSTARVPELRRLALNMFAAYALQPLHELSRSGNSDAWPCVIGLRSHRRGVCVSGHGTDVLAYAQTEDVERETDGM